MPEHVPSSSRTGPSLKAVVSTRVLTSAGVQSHGFMTESLRASLSMVWPKTWMVSRLKGPLPALAGLFLACAVSALSAAAPDSEAPASPAQYYNQGTQKFREGKLREAEASLQMAVLSQKESVQIPALYNLGHVRFQEGAQELKNGGDGKASEAMAKNACESGAGAIAAADMALGGWDVQAIAAAYMQGRGARKELKAATEAVKRALESYGAVLAKWQRASGDFKSAHELRPSDQDAQANAEVVDRSIARLVDTQQMMMQSGQCTKKNREALRQKMAELKKRLPDELKKQCEKGEEDEEDEDKPPKEPQAGQQEAKPKEGQERLLTPEEAARLLEMLRLDTNRKLPLGLNDTGLPKDKKRRDW